MKKLFRTLLVAAMIASLLCISFAAFAENEQTQAPDAPDSTVSDSQSAEEAKEADDNEITESDTLTTGAVTTAEDTESDESKADDSDALDAAVLTTGQTDSHDTEAESEEDDIGSAKENLTFSFKLIKKIAKVFDGEHTTDLVMLIVFAALLIVLIVFVVVWSRKKIANVSFADVKAQPVKILVFGALSLSIAFVLSYIKLFSLPSGGSVTLCSMLPIMVFSAWVGPEYGFLVSFCYAGLQIVQGAWFVHPVQFLFDYIFAFTALGLASFFRSERTLPIGILVAGFARMFCSVIAGFYYGAPKDMNIFAYVFIYNFITIGVETILCFVIYILPPVRKMFSRLREISFGKISA